METEIQQQPENALKRDEKGRLVTGTPPGPGRPKGKTIKERVRDYLEQHPEDMKAFVEHFVKDNKELAWQMLEGRPKGDVKMEHTIPSNVMEFLYGTKDEEDTEGAE